MRIKRTVGILLLIVSAFLLLGYASFLSPLVILNNPLMQSNYYLSFLSLLFIIGLILTISKPKEETLEQKLADVESFETSQGSRYNVLKDGRTQRYKTAEDDQRDPHNATVFIPDFETLRRAIPKENFREDLFGDDKKTYDQKLDQLFYSKRYKFHIIDKNGKILEDQRSISQAGAGIFLTVEREGKVEAYIPVTPSPRTGFSVYQTTKGNGERRMHLGHPVTKITYRNGKTAS